MHRTITGVLSAYFFSSFRRERLLRIWTVLPLLVCGVLIGTVADETAWSQTAPRITHAVDVTQTRVLSNHRPQWANPISDIGAAPPNLTLSPMTIVLARSDSQEQAFEEFLASQQDPSSPDYHNWLTPEQVGERFGLAQPDIDAVSGWLISQGLHINWVSPSRIFINFTGNAADLSRALQTEFHYYRVNGEEKIAPSTDPTIPEVLAPVVKAIRGLYTVDEAPQHEARAETVNIDAPDNTSLSGSHYVAPADFAKIYDLPAGLTGSGATIGIVGESRTYFGDYDIFRQRTATSFPNPTEVVPTAFGGVDPGPALSSPPGTGVSTSLQTEATLDVTRAASIAQGAQVLFVVATPASGGIGVDAQYLVQTSPVPAQIMSLSFGACELGAGASSSAYWQSLFQQAESEGISVFVSSGDSGASGCDPHGGTPPASPLANSINYICASSYATCVGGTEFNDTANPTQYWNTSNGNGLLSALGYIPEGGWNDPLTSTGASVVMSSGGGVSIYNTTTPAWQGGTGVPSARAGRYTPDVSFSGSCHDGYFMCLAASGGTCVTGSTGSFPFLDVCGTSASAPSMAGVAALLVQKLHGAQGSLNQPLYATAAASPGSIHDVTVASSGVTNCSVNTPSMCNNSIPSPTSLTGGQAGYLVTSGYDEVTGLGSFDVASLFNNYTPRFVPAVSAVPSPSNVNMTQGLTVSVSVTGTSGLAAPTGSVTITSGSFSSGTATLSAGAATINIAAGALPAGNDVLTVSFTPDSSSSPLYANASGSATVTVIGPNFAISGTAVNLSKGATTGNTSVIAVSPSGGFTGAVALSAAITSSPANAQYAPTLSFGSTSPVTITGTASGSATLTITTTAASSAAVVVPSRAGSAWPPVGGVAFAGVLLFSISSRRRWHRFFAVTILLVILVLDVSGCNHNGNGGNGGGGSSIPGTSSGTYTITITGTSGAMTQTGTVTLTVQ